LKTAILGILFTTGLAYGQPADPPLKFEAADIRPIEGRLTAMRTPPARNGRYELRSASLADLIATAYKIDLDKVLAGPHWIEHTRFDITAKLPGGTTPETIPILLQSLVAERFGVVLHKDSRPMPAYVLMTGKKPLLKEATGTTDEGCKPTSSPGNAHGSIRIGLPVAGGSGQGASQPITLGPDLTITYSCRNMTMPSFVASLPKMMGNGLGNKPVSDETGLKGGWDFDVRWSSGINLMASGDQPEKITLSDALDKQLGLKLEERQVPTEVLVVDKTFDKPSPNPADTAKLLPTVPLPTKFEVASVKPADPNFRGGRQQILPGGRVNVSQPMLGLLTWAFNVQNREGLADVPEWATNARYDITSQAPDDGAGAPLDRDGVAPMIRSLLEERFALKYHTEERQLMAYTLIAAKPKMKKADPAIRTGCKAKAAPPPAPSATTMLTCLNITMKEFADWLILMSPDLNWPVEDGTGIVGGWDLTLTFSNMAGMPMPMRASGNGSEGNDAADPSGRVSLFDAVEKQLGLKLDKRKRTLPVVVIDHLEQKPTDN
jgi:uncharacterized protein (TIGR03435 family)